MSWSWYIYSSKTAGEVIAYDGELSAAIEAFVADHDVDDEMAEPGPGGPAPPKPDELVAARARFGDLAPAEILERLGACRTTYAFDNARGRPEDSPLQVSVLKMSLDALAPCLIDWGDLSLELGEVALARLARMPSRGRLGAVQRTKKPPTKRRAEKPGEVRAARLIAALERAAGDQEAALDLRRAIAALSPDASRYVALLVREGAMADTKACKRLAVDAGRLALAIAELEAALQSS